jgi:hypothetical protein
MGSTGGGGAAWPQARTTSFYGKPAMGFKDTRPITDKDYKNFMHNRIHQVLYYCDDLHLLIFICIAVSNRTEFRYNNIENNPIARKERLHPHIRGTIYCSIKLNLFYFLFFYYSVSRRIHMARLQGGCTSR